MVEEKQWRTVENREQSSFIAYVPFIQAWILLLSHEIQKYSPLYPEEVAAPPDAIFSRPQVSAYELRVLFFIPGKSTT